MVDSTVAGRKRGIGRMAGDPHIIFLGDGHYSIEEIADALPVIIESDSADLRHGKVPPVMLEVPRQEDVAALSLNAAVAVVIRHSPVVTHGGYAHCGGLLDITDNNVDLAVALRAFPLKDVRETPSQALAFSDAGEIEHANGHIVFVGEVSHPLKIVEVPFTLLGLLEMLHLEMLQAVTPHVFEILNRTGVEMVLGDVHQRLFPGSRCFLGRCTSGQYHSTSSRADSPTYKTFSEVSTIHNITPL